MVPCLVIKDPEATVFLNSAHFVVEFWPELRSVSRPTVDGCQKRPFLGHEEFDARSLRRRACTSLALSIGDPSACKV